MQSMSKLTPFNRRCLFRTLSQISRKLSAVFSRVHCSVHLVVLSGRVVMVRAGPLENIQLYVCYVWIKRHNNIAVQRRRFTHRDSLEASPTISYQRSWSIRLHRITATYNRTRIYHPHPSTAAADLGEVYRHASVGSWRTACRKDAERVWRLAWHWRVTPYLIVINRLTA